MEPRLFPTASTGGPTALEVTVERIVYLNQENAWGVIRVRPRKGPRATAVGRLFGIREGERLRLTGEWVKDPQYGQQFRVEAFLPLQPKTPEGIEKYLGSGLVPGIGPVMAKRLVRRFGLRTLDVIEHEPEKLTEVEGIGPVRSQRIRKSWLEQRAVREVMLFLQSHGVSANYAVRIFKRYGHAAIEAVKSNPYRLADDVHGIGFESADRIAAALGIDRESPDRAAAGALYALGRAADQGSLYLPKPLLLERARELLGIDTERIHRAIQQLIVAGRLVSETSSANGEEALYLKYLHVAETATAERLGLLADAELEGPAIDVEAALEWFGRRHTLELAQRQREAVRLALTRKALVITGGPGTGKTTLVRAIVEILSSKRLKLELAAPTGRAAKRLSEATGHDVRTIHRLLEFEPRGGGFQRDAERPLAADLVLVDEASMLDNNLARALLEAIPLGCRLILVGDVDQLASVGPGKVLEEVIRSRRVPVVRLQEIFRQVRSSRIVVNAHRVNQGDLPLPDETHAESDFYFIEREEPEDVVATLLHLAGERVPAGFGLDPRSEIQVLTPMRRGLLGVANLNLELQKLLNPERPGAAELGGRALGDRVMQVRNNYDLEVFNGDVGRMLRLSSEGEGFEVDFDGRTVGYEFSELDQLTLAYACSVHKAQGSEYPCVLMPIHGQHTVMLQRNLLYTAMTRARKLMILVGQRKALARAVRNDRQQKRYTRLAARLAASRNPPGAG